MVPCTLRDPRRAAKRGRGRLTRSAYKQLGREEPRFPHARPVRVDPEEQGVTLGWIGAHGGEGITAGQEVRARPVWVDLEVAFQLPPGHRRRVIAEGLDLTGRVAGMLKRWVRGSRGEWYAVVWLPARRSR